MTAANDEGAMMRDELIAMVRLIRDEQRSGASKDFRMGVITACKQVEEALRSRTAQKENENNG